MVWNSHLFQNFPKFIGIHTIKGLGIVNKAEIDVFLELSCFFDDPAEAEDIKKRWQEYTEELSLPNQTCKVWIKLPISAGSWKKQESSTKTSISALLTMPKPLIVWITINCGKF